MTRDVIVVGAGPVGLMLAGELRLGGADVVVYEKLTAPAMQSRGASFTRRTAEELDQRGLLARLGPSEAADSHFAGVPMDYSILDENYFGTRGISQFRTEQMLQDWVQELGVPVRRGFEVVGLRQAADEVVAVIEGPDGRFEESAGYLAGCDGARSAVRAQAGIEFTGPEPTRGFYTAEVTGIDVRRRRIGEQLPGGGIVMAMDLENGATRIVVHEKGMPPRAKESLTFGEIADAWQRLTGESIHHARVRWISAFTDAARLATQYRNHRVFLAGDAAHVQLPTMAQGLSAGVQDAVNLGWKLAAAVSGHACDELLDTYHAERHPIGEQMVRNAQASALLRLGGDEMQPLRDLLGEMLTHKGAASYLAGVVSGLGIRYDMGPGEHPLLGRRMPADRELLLDCGSHVRVAELLRSARGVFVTTRAAGENARLVDGWADRIDVVACRWSVAGGPAAQAGGPALPDEVLIRPDGYIAWAGPGGGDLALALGRWFGVARALCEHER
jgi:2-polyprenyl-6-methoxyphenol hydroxylase-like FAD-dependent oxidoreductase